MQMIDVRIPTADKRELILTRYPQPEADLRLMLDWLKLTLPPRPPKLIAVPAALAVPM